MSTLGPETDFQLLQHLLQTMRIGDEATADKLFIENPQLQDLPFLICLMKALQIGAEPLAHELLTEKPHLRKLAFRKLSLTPLLGAFHYNPKGCSEDLFRELLAPPTDINAQQEEGWGIIHYLANRVGLLGILLDQKEIKVNLLNNKKESALAFAANCYCNNEAVALLLKNGADYWLADEQGRLPIHWACFRVDLESVSLLLKKDPNLMTAQDLNGNTPAHYLTQAPLPKDPKLASEFEEKRKAIAALFSQTSLAIENNEGVTQSEMAHYFGHEALAAQLKQKEFLTLYQRCQKAICAKYKVTGFEEAKALLPKEVVNALETRKALLF